MLQYARSIMLCSALALASAWASAQVSPSHVETTPSAKALTPGNCLTVSDGDLLTLEWNPGFDNASAVLGLREFTLRFASGAHFPISRRSQDGISLSAIPRREGEAYPFKPMGNGFYQVTFHVHLKFHETGEYRLYDADATPEVDPAYKGETPKMTNTPTNSPFCINLIPDGRR
jgi:hypothetical protein